MQMNQLPGVFRGHSAPHFGGIRQVAIKQVVPTAEVRRRIAYQAIQPDERQRVYSELTAPYHYQSGAEPNSMETVQALVIGNSQGKRFLFSNDYEGNHLTQLLSSLEGVRLIYPSSYTESSIVTQVAKGLIDKSLTLFQRTYLNDAQWSEWQEKAAQKVGVAVDNALSNSYKETRHHLIPLKVSVRRDIGLGAGNVQWQYLNIVEMDHPPANFRMDRANKEAPLATIGLKKLDDPLKFWKSPPHWIRIPLNALKWTFQSKLDVS